MSRTRNFIFTHNNYVSTDAYDTIDCRYIVYGKEIAPTTGTPHLQGFICFEEAKTLKSVIKKLPGAHLEAVRYQQQAIDYCKKDGLFTERGTPPISQEEKGKNEKRRWDDIRVAAEEGRDEDIPADIRFNSPRIIDYHRNKFLRSQHLNDTETPMLWYYGPSGSGKSRKAREENPDAFLKTCNKWWCGYVDQSTVLIEDFDKIHNVLVHHLKIWGDRYPFPAEVKGGSIKIRPKKIIVTSNYHPSEIWTEPSDLEPILRRFTVVEFPQGEAGVRAQPGASEASQVIPPKPWHYTYDQSNSK